MEVNPSNIIKYLTNEIPDLKYSLKKDVILEIEPNSQDGFCITMIIDPRESTLMFGKSGYHIHCFQTTENIDEYMQLIIDSLTGKSRVLVHLSEGKEVKWEQQNLNEENNWETVSAMGTFNWKFWKERVIDNQKILINTYKKNVC